MLAIQNIFNIRNDDEFWAVARKYYDYQAAHNDIFSAYLNNLRHKNHKENIFFLPINAFKYHMVVTGDQKPQKVFTSSGTTNANISRHYVADLSLYEEAFIKGFEYFYGQVTDYCILALLPSYLERENSSLVYMADKLIRKTEHPDSGFYLQNINELIDKLKVLEKKKQKTLLLGVSFALFDLAEEYKTSLKNICIMETGGMKGRRKELTREELHDYLCERLGIEKVHSEYGMTELLSQAYSKGDGRFYCPPWMKVLIRDINDPFSLVETGKTGGINIIDLANIHSCCFIETQDLGRLCQDGSFEVLGRFDNSDVRGCSLLV